MNDSTDPRISRRALVAGIGTTAVAGLGAIALGAMESPERVAGMMVGQVQAIGIHQAGVNRPATAQQHCMVAIVDLSTENLQDSLSALGSLIVSTTTPGEGESELVPDGPGDLSVTVGLGERALLATAHPELRELVQVPAFAGDGSLPESRLGGDLILSVNGSNPAILEPVLSALLDRVAGARVRWIEFGFRGTPVDGISRNSLGYFDGIIGPKSTEELERDVWIKEGPLSGGTICVVRRFQLDLAGFRRISQKARDRVVGREQLSGAPLSGGGRDSEINLEVKSPDGALLIPSSAHVRAAHPSFTGSPLMLRRSYSYRDSAGEFGHLFISFQNDVQTFVKTQIRMDEVDALLEFTTPTATAAFAILPGITAGADLGQSLF